MVKKICCIVYKKEHLGMKFLILHKNNWWNGWEFVRGEVENNESFEQAAIREVSHETGLNVNNARIIPFNFNYNYMKELNQVNAEVTCFAVRANNLNVKLSPEHNHYKWADYDEAMKLLDFEEQKKLLENLYYSIVK